MSNRRLALGILAFALTFVGLWWFIWRRNESGVLSTSALPAAQGQTSPTANLGVEKRTGTEGANDPPMERVRAAYATLVSFFGKVVDEAGNPVPGAQVRFVVADNMEGDGSKHQRISDPAGRFDLQGARGLTVAVWISKEGYYAPEESRGRGFVYGGVRGGNDPANPTADKPAIFILRKMGGAVRLVHVPRRSIKVPKDGKAVEIDLATGQTVVDGVGQVKIEVWTANQGVDPNKAEPYDWEARLSVPGGGLAERSDPYDFEAPVTGYAPAVEIGMEKRASRWTDGFQKEFFAKLGNGQFARIHVRLLTGGDHFIVLESYLNPDPGSRNLEFDPKRSSGAVP